MAAGGAKPEEMVSTIISHWLDTMCYLTAPDNLPMIEIVSHCSVNGVSLQSIKGKVDDMTYHALEEFIAEFAMLIEFEREELNKNMNEDIKTAEEGLKSLCKDSKAQIYRAYGIFILDQYLQDWKGKTLDKINAKTTTIEELYAMLERKRIRRSLLKPKTKISKFPEEHPERVSKRISAAQKNAEKAKYSSFKDKFGDLNPTRRETEKQAQPCCSYTSETTSEDRYASSDEELSLVTASMEMDSLGVVNRSSPSSDLLIKIQMNTLDITNEEISNSNDDQDTLDESTGMFASQKSENSRKVPESALPETSEFERCENVIKLFKSDPIQNKTDKFASNRSGTLRNVSSYHTEDPLDKYDEISSTNFDEVESGKTNPVITRTERPPIIAKRKRRSYFPTSKRVRREKRLAYKRKDNCSRFKRFKPAELNINSSDTKPKGDIDNFNTDQQNRKTTSDIESNDECKTPDANCIDTNNDLEVSNLMSTPKEPVTPPKKKASPIIYDLSPPPNPVKTYRNPPATVPIASRPTHGHSSYYFTPRAQGSQFYQRYPYTAYPPTQPTSLHRFYSRQRIPSISMIGRSFNSQNRYRHQGYSHNANFKSRFFN